MHAITVLSVRYKIQCDNELLLTWSSVEDLCYEDYSRPLGPVIDKMGSLEGVVNMDFFFSIMIALVQYHWSNMYFPWKTYYAYYDYIFDKIKILLRIICQWNKLCVKSN